jgi:multiple sugar transport system substrate-binding protein
LIRIKGIAFDHPRNVLPLRASAEAYRQEHPGVEVSWEARSLKDFEDYPVDRLAERYNLVIMDHPFVGTAVERGTLVPLDEHLPTEYLADQEANSVGPSYRSYSWEGHQWALAVDAAAQVSAYRADLLEGAGLEVPTTWDGVFGLAGVLPRNTKIALSLNPTHSFCSFVTLCANVGGDGFWDEGSGVDPVAAEEALGLLRRLATVAHEASLGLDPIQLSELMARGNEIAYAPLLFGYSNYARPGFAPRLVRFADVPSMRKEPTGSVLGGVGLAISAHSGNREAAARYAAFVADGDVQRGLYFENGGQPGHRTAWVDETVNERSRGFFRDTLRTLDLAYLRPRHSGFPEFQKRAGERIHAFLRNGGSLKQTVEDLNRLHGEARVVSRG